LNLCHYAVHIPIQALKKDVEKFKRKARALGLDQLNAFEVGEYYPASHKKVDRIIRRIIQPDPVYAAMIYNLDLNIGRLLDALNETGQADNTIIIFTSDNGGLSSAEGSPTCNFPLCEGKGWMYEGGVREPLIVRWPKVTKPGSICTEVTISPDFYPSMLEIAGLHLLPEQHVDGVSIVPLLKGAEKLEREAVYWHYPHYGNQGTTPASSMRMGDYKLIEYFEDGRLELYNLKEDIGEERNLVNDMPELVSKMHDMLAAWRRDVGAQLPKPNPDYLPFSDYYR
jgi:arylsulfatase A-like enzyme